VGARSAVLRLRARVACLVRVALPARAMRVRSAVAVLVGGARAPGLVRPAAAAGAVGAVSAVGRLPARPLAHRGALGRGRSLHGARHFSGPAREDEHGRDHRDRDDVGCWARHRGGNDCNNAGGWSTRSRTRCASASPQSSVHRLGALPASRAQASRGCCVRCGRLRSGRAGCCLVSSALVPRTEDCGQRTARRWLVDLLHDRLLRP